MIYNQVKFDTDLIDTLDTDLFETVSKLGLVHGSLHRMQTQLKDLVFLRDKTPEVECFIEWILLPSG